MRELLTFPKQRRKRSPTKKVGLTDLRVLKLAREGFHWDEKVDGLAVRITKAGTKSTSFADRFMGRSSISRWARRTG